MVTADSKVNPKVEVRHYVNERLQGKELDESTCLAQGIDVVDHTLILYDKVHQEIFGPDCDGSETHR